MTALRAYLLASAFVVATVNADPFLQRRQTNPTNLAGGWTFQGCYADNVSGGRTLTGGGFNSANAMTIESCVAFCQSNNFVYAGTEFAAECYCGNAIMNGGFKATATDCNMACNGNAQELCGGPNRLSFYWNGTTPPAPPVITPQIGAWSSLGCYSDNVNGRALPNAAAVTGAMTNAKCTAACQTAGFALAGTEFAGECYCGSAIGGGGAPTPASDCSMTCNGNSSEFCGGPNRLNVYNNTAFAGPVGGGGTGGGGGTTTGPAPVTSGLPGTWGYQGCWVDNVNGRILPFGVGATTTNTIQTCIAACQAQGYTVAGSEFGAECYCGKTLIAGATKAPDTDCNMACAGNSAEACGAGNRMSIYTSTGVPTVLPVPTTLKTGLPGQWTYQGCLAEPAGATALPIKMTWLTNNTAISCMQQCGAFGYSVAGLEFAQECWCGDITDISKGTFVPESNCNLACTGDPIHYCGSGGHLTLYSWPGGLNTWKTPANTGGYQFFVPGVVVPLIATVGINNKVTFLEKAGTGFPNSTGAYELDLSLVNDFSKTWREMHLKTDVFCSASLILPDKAGRQINVGGWSLQSTFGIRFYTPNGAPGTNSTNDWEENWQELSLQSGRWYPSSVILSNGTILVVGGEKGSNDIAVPSLEILPKPAGGNTTVYLDWLQRTDPFNLYPFLTVLPGGGLFVGYYNEARILDQRTFQTIKTLPNIPGSVDNFLAGRTYPLEGAMMPFPQHAPYSEAFGVLICGGSTPNGEALDNCVSIQPEVANPTWTIERMPSRRVLTCMVNLPDGTYLILNGAHAGTAGFGLANDPNFNALLYDPTQPISQRFSILGNTIVARMYHSEAALLPDGRVLVSGSDPQSPVYPEEFRIEVYVPPYLSQGLAQPSFTLPVRDWAYGGQYTITNIVLHQGTTATLRVSLVGATSSTHGNTFGARTIFPAASCSGTTCTITAPPNAFVSPPGWHQLFILDGPTPSHSQWVRIGGDPSQLGNWPNLPGFTPPGM